jgi:hypothetical protein
MGEIADWLTDIGETQAAKYDMAYHENAKLSDDRLVEATRHDEDGEPFEGIVESIRQFYKDRGYLTAKQRHVLIDCLSMLDVSFT